MPVDVFASQAVGEALVLRPKFPDVVGIVRR